MRRKLSNNSYGGYRGSWGPSKFSEPEAFQRGVNFLELTQDYGRDSLTDEKSDGSEAPTTVPTSPSNPTSPFSSGSTRRHSVVAAPRNKRGAKEEDPNEYYTAENAYLAAHSAPMGRLLLNLKPKSLPISEEHNKWLAHHLTDFFNEVWMLYGCLEGYCTKELCPKMTAGSRYQYLWRDGEKVHVPIACSAPEYSMRLFMWVESKLNDEKWFPIMVGETYPRQFRSLAKTILKKIFRIYAHMYRRHYLDIKIIGIEKLLNESFARYSFFVLQHKLVAKGDLKPMKALLNLWKGKTAPHKRSHSTRGTRRWSYTMNPSRSRTIRASSEPRLKRMHFSKALASSRLPPPKSVRSSRYTQRNNMEKNQKAMESLTDPGKPGHNRTMTLLSQGTNFSTSNFKSISTRSPDGKVGGNFTSILKSEGMSSVDSKGTGTPLLSQHNKTNESVRSIGIIPPTYKTDTLKTLGSQGSEKSSKLVSKLPSTFSPRMSTDAEFLRLETKSLAPNATTNSSTTSKSSTHAKALGFV